MRFLVDECTGPTVAGWLRAQGHDVFSVFEQDRGATDQAVLARAAGEHRILISNDKDFGTRVYRDGAVHSGVVLLRLSDERAANQIQVLSRLLDAYATRLPNAYTVVTEEHVRIAR